MQKAKKNILNDPRGQILKKLSKRKPRIRPLLMVPDPALRVELPISIDGPELLPSQHDFSQRLSYEMKPVKLAEVYARTRPLVLQQHGGAGLVWLNQNVTEFLHGVHEWLLPRRQSCYLGACNPIASDYAGATGEDVRSKTFQDITKEILGDLPLEKVAKRG